MTSSDYAYLVKSNIWLAHCELRDARRMMNADGYTRSHIAQALNMAQMWRNFAIHFAKKISEQRKGGEAVVMSSKSASPVRLKIERVAS